MNLPALLSFLLLGVVSAVTQLVLQRELINSFYGNELYVGVVLASWMAWTALGARWCHPRPPIGVEGKPRGNDRTFISVIFLIGLIFFGEIILLRFVKNIAGFPGEVPNLLCGTLIAFTSPAPVCLLLGAWWTLGNNTLFQAGGPQDVNRSYLFETLGFAAGGMAFGFLLVRFNELRAADIVIFLCLALLLTIRPCHPRPRLKPSGVIPAFAGTSGDLLRSRDSPAVTPSAGRRLRGNDMLSNLILALLAVSAYLFYSPILGRLDHDTSALRFKGQTLLESVNSNYGNIVVTKLGEQFNFYENGALLGTTQRVQFTEELVHLALLQHKDPKRVLLVGGGLFGAVEEIRKHPVEDVYYVELDPELLRVGRRDIPPAAASGRARLHTIVQDAYHYLKNARERFDVIIMNIPAPATQLANRFYTEDFFKAARARLNKDGIFCSYLPSSPSTLNKNLEELDTSIYRSLSSVFKRVLYLPEDSLIFLSSMDDTLTYDPAVIVSRFKARNIRTDFLPPDYFTFRLTTDRIGQMREIFERNANVPINRQFRPVAYFLQNLFWLDLFYPSVEAVYKEAAESKAAVVALFVLFAALLFISAVKRPSYIPLFSVGTGGFSLMALEIVVIFAYQAIVGYLYHRLAILIAALMLGMALAVLFGMTVLSKVSERRSLAVSHYLISWFAIVILSSLTFISRWGSSTHCEVMLSLFAAASGFFGAIIFPLSNRLYFNFKRSSSAIYSADLAGSCLGALLPLVFIPVFGIHYTLAFVAGANLLAALFIRAPLKT